MKNLRPEEEKIIKDITNLFRLKKMLKELKIKYLEIIEYYKPERVNMFWSNSYI